MRFPLEPTLKIAGHIIGHKFRGTKKFATVLQLEPLHTCNLTCTGCGRIREYSTSMKDVMPLEDCLQAARECGAPMVSICGGEPLIYPQVEALVVGLREQGRIVYICTNGMMMRRKMRDYLACEFVERPEEVNGLLAMLEEQKLILPSEAAQVRQGPKDPKKAVIRPSTWMYWNVHLDGLEKVHDIIVEREGVFRECIAAIRMAKILGFQVATNTTVYRETDMAEIETLFNFLAGLGVDGHTITPGYDYDAAKRDMAKRLNLDPSKFFLTRRATVEKFHDAKSWSWRYPLFGTPIYFEFLAGLRDLTCSAWAIPTRNIKGWKAPCYFLTDKECGTEGHFSSYAELLENVEWDKYGVVDGIARDPRCENCMVHCGYEPTASLGLQAEPGDTLKTIVFNFGSKPKPKARPEPAQVFNGISAKASPAQADAVRG
jgi:hopanoid biosynthesis associated radical SAM protein HpnH